jgi:ribose-phosphate pyrophosphokinase
MNKLEVSKKAKEDNKMKLIIGPTSENLAIKTAELTGYAKIKVIKKRFPDGEVYIRLKGSVKNENVAILHTTCPPQNINLMQLVFIASAAKLSGAKKVIGIIPYLAYARQDKIFLPGENICVDTIAQMLKVSGIDELITINIHQEDVLKRFDFPAKNLSAIPLLADYIKRQGHNRAFSLAPDKGALNIAEQAKKVLGGESGYLEKNRDRYTGELTVSKKNFNVKGKTAIIFDDIISTGGTIINAAKILLDLGASRVFAACVHPLLIGNAEKRILNTGVEEIIGTDSVPSPFSKVSLAPLISQEIKAQESG